MSAIRKISVSPGIFWVEIPEADIRILCGCPVDSVKHLLRLGLIVSAESKGVPYETGPNAILLSDLAIQNGHSCSRSEFPVLQMLYKQGMIVPGHPRNTGTRPLLIGSRGQVEAQSEYLFRGNYGLISEDELRQAGIPSEQAAELMRMKLAFAFGRIMPTDELVHTLVVGRGPVEIRNGVTVERLRTNVFALEFCGERVEVDLNLPAGIAYECPYRLDMHLLERDYFAVVHTGDGDGWDMHRPTMGSIVLYQGRVYLVDAGPNIDYALTALGISVNEIDGIFQTHCHDDHIAGLTHLIRGDRRVAYFAAPLVRSSVFKKLSNAMSLPEAELSQLFDVRDLTLDAWNDIEGMEVKPILSPHPVETTIFYFRVMWEGGYRSYAHLADIASAEVLDAMVAGEGATQGIGQAFRDATQRAYLHRANVKKIDIGGGMIHGAAIDFRGDTSDKLIFAHTARRLTEDERVLGSGAPFGTVDVLIELIEGASDAVRRRAFDYLQAYFPDAPVYRIRHLMNASILHFNPEQVLFKEHQPLDAVYLIISGSAELLRTGLRGSWVVSAGSILGETPALTGSTASETCRAVSFVQALRLPRDLYLDFVRHSAVQGELIESRKKLDFLRSTRLFSDSVSCVTLSKVLRAASFPRFAAGTRLTLPTDALHILREGDASLSSASGYREQLGAGGYFGATDVSGYQPRGVEIDFQSAVETCSLPVAAIAQIPVVRWKLYETHRRRFQDD